MSELGSGRLNRSEKTVGAAAVRRLCALHARLRAEWADVAVPCRRHVADLWHSAAAVVVVVVVEGAAVAAAAVFRVGSTWSWLAGGVSRRRRRSVLHGPLGGAGARWRGCGAKIGCWSRLWIHCQGDVVVSLYQHPRAVHSLCLLCIVSLKWTLESVWINCSELSLLSTYHHAEKLWIWWKDVNVRVFSV